MRVFLTNSELTLSQIISRIFLFMFCTGLLVSCGVRRPPVGVPYVYENKINLNGISGESKTVLAEKLYLYLDDSMKVATRGFLGTTQRISPPLFDSANIFRSVNFIKGYLNSIGYYGAEFDTITVKFDTVAKKESFFGKKIKQIRTHTSFNINLGKVLRVDTLIYNFKSSVLQRLADSSIKAALLKRNTPYSKELVGLELDRLTNLFRRQGFFKISRSSLLVEGDTTDPSLINFDIDPVAQLLAARRRKENPRISLMLTERPLVEEKFFQQYFIDTVYIYPQTKITEEVADLMKDSGFIQTKGKRTVVIKERYHFFSNKMIRRYNYLYPSRIYNEDAYFRTVNAYWRLGPWQQVDVKTTELFDSVPKINFHIFLYPGKKQNFQVDLEGSQNNNISLSNALSGRFLALGLNGTLRNRNFFGTGTQASTSARLGFELNNSSPLEQKFFQTLIVSINQSFSIPRLLEPLPFFMKKRQDAQRTLLSFGTSYTDRFNFYSQRNTNLSLQWEWQRGRNSFTFTLPNFESVSIIETDSLQKEIVKNPSLRYAFTPGNILSIRSAWEHKLKFAQSRNAGYTRLAAELSPIYFTFFGKESFQFFKVEGQFVRSTKLFNSASINYRLYGGVGWDISSNPDGTLPYFRQYVAGGSNSMRAWQLRTLGVGNSIVSDTTKGFNDRFGDIQLETNLEYRFKMFRLLGFNFDGAAFADVGNIWNQRNNIDGTGAFRLPHLYRDLALCMGMGLRIDVSYLVIRLDAAYKVKDPVRGGAGWIKDLSWKTANRLGTMPRNNLGFQFGIGYPF